MSSQRQVKSGWRNAPSKHWAMASSSVPGLSFPPPWHHHSWRVRGRQGVVVLQEFAVPRRGSPRRRGYSTSSFSPTAKLLRRRRGARRRSSTGRSAPGSCPRGRSPAAFPGARPSSGSRPRGSRRGCAWSPERSPAAASPVLRERPYGTGTPLPRGVHRASADQVAEYLSRGSMPPVLPVSRFRHALNQASSSQSQPSSEGTHVLLDLGGLQGEPLCEYGAIPPRTAFVSTRSRFLSPRSPLPLPSPPRCRPGSSGR